MRFEAEAEVARPVEAVWGEVSDFGRWEWLARDRGARLERADNLDRPGAGMTWRGAVDLAGKERTFEVLVDRHDPPHLLGGVVRVGGATGTATVRLEPLGPGRTRLEAVVDLTAEGLSGRLLIQSLRLIRGQIDTRVERRMQAFAREVEERTA
ncbi:SRPBCC family protein [Roseitranquillus sediminis]|uniref:SRPBCC family protein n=1 Tax=Roseitranquillus sediminis TaxID=2809051 RepID=UPI001D0C2915|nr:SRPBCC family protein [Roseitranquillus sediminis]MBM9593264.1 SRPBCC family protein [Roseitranquillus sediminis]